MPATPPYTAYVAFSADFGHLFDSVAGINVAPVFMVVDINNSVVVAPNQNTVVNLFPGDDADKVRERFEYAVLNLGAVTPNPVTFVWLNGPREKLDVT